VPLGLIALATDWERSAWVVAPVGRFGNQTVVVAASLGMLAWLLSRRFGWGWTVASWTVAVGIVVVVAAARVYVGWSWPSEVIASTLLGGLWVLVFVVAWHTRDQIRAGVG
jgi:membrane-associated phospholipid phosphatase